MLNPCKIEEIKQRLENTSPGPWKIESYECRNYLMRLYGDWHVDYDAANYEFIANSKNDINLLIKELERCKNHILELEEQVDFFRTKLEELK